MREVDSVCVLWAEGDGYVGVLGWFGGRPRCDVVNLPGVRASLPFGGDAERGPPVIMLMTLWCSAGPASRRGRWGGAGKRLLAALRSSCSDGCWLRFTYSFMAAMVRQSMVVCDPSPWRSQYSGVAPGPLRLSGCLPPWRPRPLPRPRPARPPRLAPSAVWPPSTW